MRFEHASRDRLTTLENLAPRFFREVLEYEYDECFVTDESDLRDFADVVGDRDAAVAAMLDRMRAHYWTDTSALGSTRIVDLLQLLQDHGITE